LQISEAYKFLQAASMNNKPIVSCVIIFLNAGKFLAESVDSVLEQTYDNWELFLVDDGSTDESSAIALSYADKHPAKIFYLEHEGHKNRGKNVSRNLGIARARGCYVALLDADDVWLPEKLTEQVTLMKSLPQAGMLYGRTQIWFSWAGCQGGQNSDSFYDLGVVPDTLVQPPGLFYHLLERYTQSPTTCNAIIRRTVFEKIGNFDETYHGICEDLIFFVKVELAYPVFVADNVWARYRQHPESSMVAFSQTGKQGRLLRYSVGLEFLNWVESYLHEQDYKDATVWEFLLDQQKSAKRKLRMIQDPMLGPIMNPLMNLAEWLLSVSMWIGRRVLSTDVRDWLWRKIGKKSCMYFQ